MRCSAAAIAALAAAATLGLARTAHADLRGLRATGDLALDLRGTRGEGGAVEAGPGLRATAGSRWLGYALGIDVRAGGGIHGGFALDAALYPVGVSLFHGAPVSARIVAGIGTGGVTGHLPFAARVPVEAELELHPIRPIELSVWGEAAWVTGDARSAGAPNAPFGDELSLGATVRIGRGKRMPQSWAWSNGWRVGVLYTERLGERRFGLVLGYGIDISFGPQRPYDTRPV